MKKTIYLLLGIILSLISCGKKTDFTLKGNISDLNSDTILVYYQLPKFKLDTIITQNGEFNYHIQPDTFTIFNLVFDSINSYPIYADKGGRFEINGTLSDFNIKGDGENLEQYRIMSYLKQVPNDSIEYKVDSIIRSNGHSFTNIYLLDKYFVHDSTPDYTKIKELINKMSGLIKDTPYIMNLQAKIESLTKKESNRSVYTLNIKDREGKDIKWGTIKDKYILIDFWASWDAKSVEAQDSLVPVLKELKKEKFLIVSISLDLDKEAWLQSSERDTTQWIQACDFTGWNNKLVKDQSIYTLPSNILLDKTKRIIDRDIREEELINRVKTLIKQDKEREKAKKEAERKRKRK